MTTSPRSCESSEELKPYVSKLGAWALAVGTSIGWGSLVVTNGEYLAAAGPAGSVLGMLIGAAIMLVIARNFVYMLERCQDAGGVYAYVKTVFGYDRAFLISWFVSLTYLAVLWANATSVPLFARYFIGDMFRFGYLYTLFNYDVYAGEILITFVVFLLFGLICFKSKNLSLGVIIGTVIVFCAGIVICFLGAVLTGGGQARSFDPAFIPDVGAANQVLAIVLMTPWAFIGFESISHSSEEFRFPAKGLSRIFIAAVVVTTLLYILVLLLSVTAYPAGYESWLDYISDLDNLSGIEGLPAFYAAYTYLGNTGIVILMIALAGLVISSLIGNMVSLSRLFYALARDRILSEKFAALDGNGLPYKAVLLVIAVSIPFPFVGRTAIGWIVGVTTIGATLLYGFVSAATLRASRRNGDRSVIATSLIGFVLMVVFGAILVVESIFGDGALTRESQLIVIIWSVLGLYYFRIIMVRDHGRRFGKNLTVWIALVAFIFVMTMIWICEACSDITTENLLAVRNYYASGADVAAIADDPVMGQYFQNMMMMIVGAAAGVVGIFAVSFSAMISNWLYVRKCEDETVHELGMVKTIAYMDSMTGVKSKHAFVEKESELDAAIDVRNAGEFAVLVCDVNGLKHINDTLGHKAGDQYIREASSLICESFKHSPVYRVGGDEFVVLMDGQDYPDRQALVAAFDRQIEENLTCGKVVVSTGLSDYDPQNDNSFHAVFERADKLMYDRKQLLKSKGAITRD